MTNPEAQGAIHDVIEEGAVTGTQILVFAIALILNMLDGFDITAMAFTAHSIGQELSIAPEYLGVVFSATLAGMMIGAMFVAPFSDVVGRRDMILYCVTAIGVSMFATGFANSFWQLVVLRLIAGLGVGGMLASLAAITAEFSPAKYRSLAVMSVTAGYPLGATLGGFFVAPLIPIYGWQVVFFAGGAATLSMVVVIFFLLPESLQFLVTRRPAGALQRTNDVLQKLGRPPLESLPDIDTDRQEKRANVFTLLAGERRSSTLILWVTFFFCFISLYFLMSWIPKLVVMSGLSEADGVYASVAFNAGGVFGIITLGWLASIIGLSRLISIFLSMAAAGMVVFALSDGTQMLFYFLVAIGFMVQGGFTGLYAVAAKLYPTEIRTTGVGWAIGLGRFGAVVGPLVGGFLIAKDVSMAGNFLFFAVPLFVAGIIAYQLKLR